MWVWQSLRKQDVKQDDEKGKKKDGRTPATCVAPEGGEDCGALLCADRGYGQPGTLPACRRFQGICWKCAQALCKDHDSLET